MSSSPVTKPSTTHGDRRVDHSALRTNQVFIISLLILGFILNAPLWVGFVSAVLLIGTLFPPAGLFKSIYWFILKPTGLVKSDIRVDNPEPHQFAQFLGGIFTLLSTIALALNSTLIGWSLAWIVVALAALNLFAGICVGCVIYYQLHRLGITGFTRAPLQPSADQ